MDVTTINGSDHAESTRDSLPKNHHGDEKTGIAKGFYGLKFKRKGFDLGGEFADVIVWDEPKTAGYKSYPVYEGAEGMVQPQDAFMGMHVFLPGYPPIEAGAKLRLRIVGNGEDLYSDYIEVSDEDGGVIDPQIKDLAFVMDGDKAVAVKWSSPETHDTQCVARTLDHANRPIGDYLSGSYPASAKKIPLRRPVYSGERIGVITTPATGGEFLSNVLSVPRTAPLPGGDLPLALNNVRIAGGILTWEGPGYGGTPNTDIRAYDRDIGRSIEEDVCSIRRIDYLPENNNRAFISTTPGVPFRLVYVRRGTASQPTIFSYQSDVIIQ